MRRGGLLPGRALVCAALLLATSCARDASRAGKAGDAALPVTVVRPEHRTLTRSLRIPATVEAIEKVTLYARTAGYLERITVDRGDSVRRGQVLAAISVPEMEKDHDAAAARLRQAEADLALQRVTLERLEAVRQAEPGAVTQQQVDEGQGRLQVAEATVGRLRAELAQMETMMGYATIRAPFDGVVTERYVDPGALIPVGTGSTQEPIATLMNMDTVRVFVDVPEPDVPFVTRKTSVHLALAALPGRDFEATVTRYATALDPETRTMKTEIDFRNRDHSLRPGMYGVATLILEKRDNALSLPATALLLEKDRPYVFTVSGGAARRIPVTIGLDDGIVVEILDGLKGDELVIVGGKGIVTEGMLVRVGESG